MEKHFFQKMSYAFVALCLFSSTAVLTTACENDEEIRFSYFDPCSNIRAVDLGLSVKWANCNLGASKPEDFGYYYTWGALGKEATIDTMGYKFYQDNDSAHFQGNDSIHNIYGTNSDIAHLEWGGNWRMPSKEEIKELVEKCSWTWTSHNGVNGYFVTGPNGYTIFMPAAGACSQEGLYGTKTYGRYWSGTRHENAKEGAYYLDFKSSQRYYDYWHEHSTGYTIRPVFN